MKRRNTDKKVCLKTSRYPSMSFGMASHSFKMKLKYDKPSHRFTYGLKFPGQPKKNITCNFQFGTTGKLMVLGVPITFNLGTNGKLMV